MDCICFVKGHIGIINAVKTSKAYTSDHSVWFERDVRRIDFVVIFFQWTQNWTALNFEVNFQPLIQLNSRGSQNNSWKGH